MDKSDIEERMVLKLINDLCHLASLKIQDRYIVGATAEYYLLADELLENIYSQLSFFRFEKFPKRIHRLEQRIGSVAFKKLLDLESFINNNPQILEEYRFETIRQLIHEDLVWQSIREKAKDILSELRVDLEQWEDNYD